LIYKQILLLKLASSIQVENAEGNLWLMDMWEVSPDETHCLSWPETLGSS